MMTESSAKPPKRPSFDRTTRIIAVSLSTLVVLTYVTSKTIEVLLMATGGTVSVPEDKALPWIVALIMAIVAVSSRDLSNLVLRIGSRVLVKLDVVRRRRDRKKRKASEVEPSKGRKAWGPPPLAGAEETDEDRDANDGDEES